ncbi:DUF885 family protein [bacterium]|nr:DUF885 family protein [bacterium]
MHSRISKLTVILCIIWTAGAAAQSALEPLLIRYTEDRAIMRRTYDLPFYRPHQERWKQFYDDWEKTLHTVTFDSLDRDGRVDWLLFENLLTYEKRALQDRNRRDADMQPLLPFATGVVFLEESRRAGRTLDARTMADSLTGITAAIGEMTAGLDAPSLPLPVLRELRIYCRRLHSLLEEWYEFSNGYDPLFTWWMERPWAASERAFTTLFEELDRRIGRTDARGQRPIVGNPIGEQGLERELRLSLIADSPRELIEIGKREYAWCERELIRASREMGFGDDWLKALEHVKSLHLDPGEQPALIRRQALEATAFVEDHDLITVPQLAKETWKVEMMSPRRQLVNPFFTGGEYISVSFPANSMEHGQKIMSMRGNNPHFCRATVHHELIPGHHLQGFMTGRCKPYRRIFATPFWLEGWPLHWEMLLWDLDFPRSPEDRMGMLFWRTHRAARIIFSLGFHLGEMTPQECIDFLVQKVGHEPANAEAEVRRSFEEDYPPLYQAAYLIGGLQMRSLYEECTTSGAYTPREFHDAVMRENSMPIAMLRAQLLGIELKKDGMPMWDFK